MNQSILNKRSLATLGAAFLLVCGLAFAWAARPVIASPVAQVTTGTSSGTGTLTSTQRTGTVSPTTATTANPGAALTATRTPTPTPSRTPFVFRTPTLLSPVTGGEMADAQPSPNAGTWVAIWMVGLLLVGYGVWAKMNRR